MNTTTLRYRYNLQYDFASSSRAKYDVRFAIKGTSENRLFRRKCSTLLDMEPALTIIEETNRYFVIEIECFTPEDAAAFILADILPADCERVG